MGLYVRGGVREEVSGELKQCQNCSMQLEWIWGEVVGRDGERKETGA